MPSRQSLTCDPERTPLILCGVPVAPGVRNFCRQAACPKCLRYACNSRAQRFVEACDRAGANGPWRGFRVPVEAFNNWRGMVHDRFRNRRASEPRWRSVALLGRWDGRTVAGVILMGEIGVLDLPDLLSGDGYGIASWPLAHDPVCALVDVVSAGSLHDQQGSMKSIFLTVRPCLVGKSPSKSQVERTPFCLDPMPILF